MKKILMKILGLFEFFIFPIIWSYRHIAAKKTVEYIYKNGIKHIETIIKKSENKFDDSLFEKYNKNHAKKVLKWIDSMPGDNKKIEKELNKKTQNSEIDFTVSDKKIGINVGSLRSEYDINSKKINLGIKLRI